MTALVAIVAVLVLGFVFGFGLSLGEWVGDLVVRRLVERRMR